MTTVKTGLDVLVEEGFERLVGKRVAVLAHPASVDAHLKHIVDLCVEYDVQLVRLFGPEHGVLGHAQDMETVAHVEHYRGIPLVSLYGSSKDSLFLKPENLADVDILVCDLQDVGSRYYTFAYTLAFALRACAKANVQCLVLDRPNPIGGRQVEGNLVLENYKSFVGEYPLENRHGLTIGELAQFFVKHDKLSVNLDVVWMQGWRREMYFEQTGLPWVLPSPNMPTIDTAVVYPGGCLWEGTNLSEGRGTTKPFELVGAPYIEDAYHFAELITSQNLPGVICRPCWFKPMFQKHAKQLCGGVQLHVTRRESFLPLRTGVAVIWAAMQFAGFDWRREEYEFVSDKLAIDLLFGDDKQRMILEKGGNTDDVMNTMIHDHKVATRYL